MVITEVTEFPGDVASVSPSPTPCFIGSQLDFIYYLKIPFLKITSRSKLLAQMNNHDGRKNNNSWLISEYILYKAIFLHSFINQNTPLVLHWVAFWFHEVLVILNNNIFILDEFLKLCYSHCKWIHLFSQQIFFEYLLVSVRILGARNTDMNKVYTLLKYLLSNNNINYVDDHVSHIKSRIGRWRWASGYQEPVCQITAESPEYINRSGTLKKLSKYFLIHGWSFLQLYTIFTVLCGSYIV